MKTIILVSSIFYILGLKISNKIDIIKHPHTAVEKVIVNKTTPMKTEKSIDLKEAAKLETEQDSVAGGGITSKILEYK